MSSRNKPVCMDAYSGSGEGVLHTLRTNGRGTVRASTRPRIITVVAWLIVDTRYRPGTIKRSGPGTPLTLGKVVPTGRRLAGNSNPSNVFDRLPLPPGCVGQPGRGSAYGRATHV